MIAVTAARTAVGTMVAIDHPAINTMLATAGIKTPASLALPVPSAREVRLARKGLWGPAVFKALQEKQDHPAHKGQPAKPVL